MQASQLICFCMILAMPLIIKWETFHIGELYLEGVTGLTRHKWLLLVNLNNKSIHFPITQNDQQSPQRCSKDISHQDRGMCIAKSRESFCFICPREMEFAYS